jgi:hypothetical protein
MTFPQVFRLFRYWRNNPPVHELLAMGIRVFTTWKPENERKPEFDPVAHQKSLEQRWKNGYMNIKQMFEAQGGSGFGVFDPKSGVNPPGIGPFPGLH